MDQEATLLRRIEGKHTIETFMKQTALTKESALNLLSLLRKKGYVHTEGGGKQKIIVHCRQQFICLLILKIGQNFITLQKRSMLSQLLVRFMILREQLYEQEEYLSIRVRRFCACAQ